MSLHKEAKAVQSRGRGEDTMLVHMTPGEVNGLQNLALSAGGSLTINPDTGLPEAGFLSKMLPMIAGAALTFFSGGALSPLAAGLMVGGGATGVGLAKGKGLGGALGSGLMAGLGAYGGASLGAAAGIGKTAVASAVPTAGTAAGQTAANLGRTAWANEGMAAFNAGAPQLAGTAAGLTAAPAATPGMFGAFGDRFAAGASRPMMGAGTSNFMGSWAPKVAAAGVMTGLTGAMTPGVQNFSGMGGMGGADGSGAGGSGYAGPYKPQPREVQYPTGRNPYDSSEFSYFNPSNPYPGFLRAAGGGMVSFAEGGLNLQDGSFVVDARTVAEAGNGNTNVGQQRMMAAGGVPVTGPGDGVSDSIPATIDGRQQALVSNGEVVFSPERVKQLGGAQRLYAMMDAAAAARKSAKRGEDTGGLQALMSA